MPAAMAA